MNQQAQLEEYKMLRNDIQYRIQFRSQLFGLLIAALGVLLPLGLKEPGSPIILLTYPVVSFFLSMNWIHQGVVMVKIARYLRDELEPKVPGLEWEAYLKKESPRFSTFSIIGLVASSGFILFSQTLTLALAFLGIISDRKWDTLTVFLSIVACLVTILTFYFLIFYSRMKR